VSAPGDCEDGEVCGMNGFGKENGSTRRKPSPTPLCPPQIPFARPGREPGPRRQSLIAIVTMVILESNQSYYRTIVTIATAVRNRNRGNDGNYINNSN
jgi:hypothetical protein